MAKVAIVCKKHGTFYQSLDAHVGAGQGCPNCANRISKGETEVANYIKELSIGILCQYKFVKGRQHTVDIFVPDRKVAVEYDGIRWHSTKFKSTSHHSEKREALALLGIDLIRVFDSEWLGSKEQVKSRLNAALSPTPTLPVPLTDAMTTDNLCVAHSTMRKLGYTKVEDVPPYGWWYVLNGRQLHLDKPDNVEASKLFQVYDCGLARWKRQPTESQL